MLAFVSEFAANGETGLAVDRFLLTAECLRSRPACRGCIPASEFLIAHLRVLVAVAVDPVDMRAVALVLEAAKLL
ncbi:MAG TPA: hypothetical protein VGT81_07430, partial [Casimicrobiaceae bacterium]|nr:hypothetical protein [Casimicrobiaceae bacterium]